MEFIEDNNDFSKLKGKNGEEKTCASCIRLYLTVRRLWNRYGPLSYKVT